MGSSLSYSQILVWCVGLFFLTLPLSSQEKGRGYTLHVRVVDAASLEGIESASVLVRGESHTWGMATDRQGWAVLRHLPSQRGATMIVRSLGYKQQVRQWDLLRSDTIEIHLAVDAQQIEDVVVTARESVRPITSGIISRQSINLLQPSTFTDLLSLLPGGRTAPPSLSGINTIRLREASAPSSDAYRTTSLGVAFEIDGVPLNPSAQMQSYNGRVWGNNNDRRAGKVFNLGEGVDMRSISTDDIEEVEVMRGIPSVVYGNLTSGLVRIKRRIKAHRPQSRLKVDAKSKLVFVGSGIDWRQGRSVLNLSLDYLDSKISPINNYSNFRRLTLSARHLHRFDWERYEGQWRQSLDYGGTFDNSKADPEQQVNLEDSFYSGNSRFSLSEALELQAHQPDHWLQRWEIQGSLSMQRDIIRETRFVSSVRINPLTDVLEGESDAFFAPNEYVAHMFVEGLPVTAFFKSMLHLKPWGGHKLLLGAEYNFAKNYGRGALYDISLPIDLGLPTRLRPHYAIPADHKLSLFIEDQAHWDFSPRSTFEAVMGVRMQTMYTPKEYDVRGKIHLDPRANLRYQYKFGDLDTPFTVGANVGVGLLSMLPSAAYLYAAPSYLDIVELNYYPLASELRRIHFRTYALDPVNYSLTAPRNFKAELRLDASYRGYFATCTLFREDLRNGYRNSARYASFPYHRYDPSGLDSEQLTAPPRLEDIPYVVDTLQTLYGVTTNGSRTLKKGIEWQLATPRYSSWGTRITWSGAWFESTYHNSESYLAQPSVIIQGRELSVVGVYDEDTRYVMSTLSSSLMFDTYISSLDLIFATTLEMAIWDRYTSYPSARRPIRYIDRQGVEHPFTDASLADPELNALVRPGSREIAKSNIPFAGFVHFKATKQLFDKRIGVALFVNRLLSVEPLYKRSGRTIRRSSTPYFGMEINVRF